MKSVTFEIDGQSRALRFDVNAMVRYQDRSGETISALIKAITDDGLDVLRARRVFWAALTESVTEDAAGEIMSAVGTGRALELAVTALRYALEDINGGDGSENPSAPRGEAAAI